MGSPPRMGPPCLRPHLRQNLPRALPIRGRHGPQERPPLADRPGRRGLLCVRFHLLNRRRRHLTASHSVMACVQCANCLTYYVRLPRLP